MCCFGDHIWNRIMTSLSLLSNYASDSDCESEDKEIGNAKGNLEPVVRKRKIVETEENDTQKKKLPPLPLSVQEMFQEKIHRDDPRLHGGRKRSFAHERGNWATYVYIEYPDKQFTFLSDWIEQWLENRNDCWKILPDFHISTSRTVALPHHCIDPLVSELTQQLSSLKPFTVKFSPSDIKHYTNDEKSRSFLSMKVELTSCKFLKEVVEQVDSAFAAFRLEKYYTNPSFHLSVAWKVGEIEKSDKTDAISSLSNLLIESEKEDPECFEFEVRYIHCKSGNKLFKFDLECG